LVQAAVGELHLRLDTGDPDNQSTGRLIGEISDQ